ncbi:TolC family protein [Desulfobacterales bacterium HSG17]|nr:TolC family protein [Desulfobacterales bacterium HSG17]
MWFYNAFKSTMVIVLFWGIQCASLSTVSAEELALTDFYRMALKNAETIRISAENIEIAKQTKKQAISVLVPTISAFGQYSRYDESRYVRNTTTIPLPAPLTPITFESESLVRPKWNSQWGIQAQQSFTVNGKELIAYSVTKDQIHQSEMDLDSIRADYLLNVTAAYYNVLKGEESNRTSEAEVARLEKHLESIEARLALEDVTKTELFRTQAELSGARSILIQAENSAKLTYFTMARLVGISADFSVNPVPENMYAEAVEELPVLIEMSMNNRTEIKSLETSIIIAEKQIRFDRSDYWPRVTLQGQWVNTDQQEQGESIDSIVGTAQVGWNLFQGGLRKATVNISKARKRQAELALEDKKKEIRVDMEQAYLNLMTQKSVLTSLTDRLSFARENYEAVTSQFEYGLANSVDVMDANTLLVTAEKDLTEAEFNHQLARVQVERIKGSFLNEIKSRVGE